jgi:hypothetical protein
LEFVVELPDPLPDPEPPVVPLPAPFAPPGTTTVVFVVV